MTAVISGEADIGFMGSEASIYTYNEGANDSVVNFAQLTQRAGNFLVAREEMKDFKWTDLKGKDVLGGRKGGMPEMVFEYILKKNGIDPQTDLNINQGIDFGSTAAAFSEGSGDFTVEFEPSETAHLVLTAAMFLTLPTAQRRVISTNILRLSNLLQMRFKKVWILFRFTRQRRLLP